MRVFESRLLSITLGFFAVVIAVLIGFVPAVLALSNANVIAIQSVRFERPIAPGRTRTLVITVQVLPRWHINSDHPTSSYYIPTHVTVATPPNVSAGEVDYPTAHEVSLEFAKGEKLSVFSGDIAFKVPLTAGQNFKNDAAPVTVRIDYQACNDRQCLRPTFVATTFDLASASTGLAAGPNSGPPDGTADGGFDGQEASLANVFASHGYFLGFLVVLLGGLALNLTPCVYPLIGVTVAYFGFEGGGPRKIVILAIVYVLGIALMFSSVGVAVALSGGLFGAALQNPYVLGTIAAMLLVLAASSFGLFTIQPPQWMMRRAGASRPGYIGALVMGLGMGIVAAPCIGPIVLGLLLMVQRSGSAIFGFALFFTLAIGLGIPYIALAMAAGSIRRLPRSGEWLAWVEQLFGFVLLGLALYFLDPVVPNRLMMRILPYYAAAAGIFLGFLSPEGRRWQPFLVLRTAVGVISIGALIYMLIPTRTSYGPLTFEPFDPALLQTARAERRPVVVDFSADWCVPCREMEHTTFVDPAVVREAKAFLRLRANLTADNPQNQAIINQFNIEGVPTTVFIDPNGKVRMRRVGYIGPDEFLKYLHEYD
jgi:thioredoxin:protein disulfide reductase